jgi:phage terminase large subunit GpA-like protein
MIATFARTMKAPSDLHPADWCAEHVHVENSERADKFDPSQTRWWRKPMGHFADYETRQMVCLMPTGTGKSTFFEAIGCWIPAEAPGSTLYASQTDSDAERWNETRYLKAARRCKPLDHLWPQNIRNSVRKDMIVWPHMFMTIGGANKSNFQEQSITYGLGDEAWTWRQGLVREWNARSHSRENRKFVLVSQGGEIGTEDNPEATSELHTEHAKCRQWDFAWQCPECCHVQAFDSAALKYPEKGTDQERADAVVMVCGGCKHEFPDDIKTRRMLHDSYTENDGYLCANENGQRGYEGFHLDRTGVWWQAWGDYVLKELAANRKAKAGDYTELKQLYQKDKAVGWTENLQASEVALKPSGYTRADFSEGQKIDGEVVRFCTIDAGGDHFWLRVRAWQQGGGSKGLFFGYINTVEECEHIRARYGVEPKHTFLDVGFDQERMAGIINCYGWQGLKGDGNRKSGWDWPIKGDPTRKEIRLYSKKWFALSKEKKPATCWHIATEPIQYILQRLMSGEGAEWLVEDDAPPSYAKHLNGERLETAKDAKGREIRKWIRRGANHGRDTEIYQVAAALMFRVFTPPKTDDE